MSVKAKPWIISKSTLPMINDKEFKARLREAVLDFLQQKGRVPTQKELRALYGITPKMLVYFRMTRGSYKNTAELIRDCVGSEVLEKYQAPFEKQLKSILLKHMEKFGCLPFGREYEELYGISYAHMRYQAWKKGLSTNDYLYSLVKDNIEGTPLEKSFVLPRFKKPEYNREKIKNKLQEGHSLKELVKELNISNILLKKFLKDNDLEKYIADSQTRIRKSRGLDDLRQYHDYIKKSLEEGRTIYQIAGELDVGFRSIRTYVKNWKLWHLHKPIGPPPPQKKFRFE